MKKGTAVTFFGVVSPNHAGDLVALQLSLNGVWVTQSQSTLDQDSAYTWALDAALRGHLHPPAAATHPTATMSRA